MATTGEQKIEIKLPQNLQPVYWGALGIGALLLLIGFGGNYAYLTAACFFGIVARIIQAEHHVRMATNLKSVAMASSLGPQADG